MNSKTSTKPAENTQLPADSRGIFPLTRQNFILMAVAVAMIIIGFVLMLGPGSTETEFNPDIFSTRRIVIGPLIALAGFIFMGFAIMWKSKKLAK